MASQGAETKGRVDADNQAAETIRGVKTVSHCVEAKSGSEGHKAETKGRVHEVSQGAAINVGYTMVKDELKQSAECMKTGRKLKQRKACLNKGQVHAGGHGAETYVYWCMLFNSENVKNYM